MRTIIAILYIPYLWFVFYRVLRNQKRKTEKWVLEVIDSAQISITVLPQDTKKKIMFYYGTAVPALVGRFLSLIRRKSLTEKELRALTFFGAATGLFDDMFDEEKYSDYSIEKMLVSPEQYVVDDDETRAFIALYIQGLKESKYPQSIKKCCLDLLEVQKQSRKQKTGTLTMDELTELTFKKGALSLRLYAELLDTRVEPSELYLLEAVGGVGQLENDIFDVWKDTQEGIQTLATLPNGLEFLSATYKNRIGLALEAFKRSNLQNNISRRFFCLLASRGFVCLDKFQKVCASNQGKYNPVLHPRELLVCDMQSLHAQIRNLYHYLRLSAF